MTKPIEEIGMDVPFQSRILRRVLHALRDSFEGYGVSYVADNCRNFVRESL